MSEIHSVVTTLQGLKGKAKLTFMEEVRDTKPPELVEDLKKYLSIVYGSENWYQTKIPEGGNTVAAIGKPKLTALQAIDEFFSGNRRGNVGTSRLGSLSSRCATQGDRELLQWALWKDLKAGFGPISINKVFPGLIFIPPYQRLTTLDKGKHHDWNWTEGVFVQEKADFMFGNLIIRANGGGELRSRNFNLIESDSVKKLVNQGHTIVENYYGSDMVFHGELYVTKDGQPLGREASNGLVNSIIQTGEELSEGFEIGFICWDVVDYCDFVAGFTNQKYRSRFYDLECAYLVATSLKEMEGADWSFNIMETRTIYDLNELREAFSQVVNGRGEGVVIKNPDGIWEHCDGGHKDAVKVKVQIDEVDLKITGFNEADAKSKHADTFASLQCESEDGTIITGVSGMTDAMRKELSDNRDFYTGKIIAARCNGIQYNPEEPHSLYFAQFVEVRRDKTVADDFERIQAIQLSAIESKIMSKEI